MKTGMNLETKQLTQWTIEREGSALAKHIEDAIRIFNLEHRPRMGAVPIALQRVLDSWRSTFPELFKE